VCRGDQAGNRNTRRLFINCDVLRAARAPFPQQGASKKKWRSSLDHQDSPLRTWTFISMFKMVIPFEKYYKTPIIKFFSKIHYGLFKYCENQYTFCVMLLDNYAHHKSLFVRCFTFVSQLKAKTEMSIKNSGACGEMPQQQTGPSVSKAPLLCQSVYLSWGLRTLPFRIVCASNSTRGRERAAQLLPRRQTFLRLSI
jgi:hypothetical protein